MIESSDRYLVLGDPITHSLSPKIHTVFAEKTGEKLVYEALCCPKEQFTDCLKAEVQAGTKGFNITVPLKALAYRAADSLSQEAEQAQAVNTLQVLADGSLYGHNTDGIGFIKDFLNNCKGQLRDQKILILGAGGAVRGILGPILRESPQSVLVANRTKSRALDLIADFETEIPIEACGLDEVPLDPFSVVIQGTAAALDKSLLQIPPETIVGSTICYDLMYSREAETPFLRWAKQQGAQNCQDGLGMLVEQAAEAFFLWRGVRPDTKAVLTVLGR